MKVWDIKRIKDTHDPEEEELKKEKKKMPHLPYMADMQIFKQDYLKNASKNPPEEAELLSAGSNNTFKNDELQPVFGYPTMDFEDPTNEICPNHSQMSNLKPSDFVSDR